MILFCDISLFEINLDGSCFICYNYTLEKKNIHSCNKFIYALNLFMYYISLLDKFDNSLY